MLGNERDNLGTPTGGGINGFDDWEGCITAPQGGSATEGVKTTISTGLDVFGRGNPITGRVSASDFSLTTLFGRAPVDTFTEGEGLAGQPGKWHYRRLTALEIANNCARLARMNAARHPFASLALAPGMTSATPSSAATPAITPMHLAVAALLAAVVWKAHIL